MENETIFSKPKSKSRTLRLHKLTGYASSAIAGLMALGDSFGYMTTDWTCIALLLIVIGLSVYGYWLRLNTGALLT
jgi:hypothetical protein